MQKYDIDNVPNGNFWYRSQYRISTTDETKWGPWEIVLVHNQERGSRLWRYIAGRHWRERLDKLVAKVAEHKLLCEFYEIPNPPVDYEDHRQTETPEGSGVQPEGGVAEPAG